MYPFAVSSEASPPRGNGNDPEPLTPEHVTEGSAHFSRSDDPDVHFSKSPMGKRSIVSGS